MVRSTAARLPRCGSTSRVKPPRSLPASTATKWRDRAEQGPRSPSPPSARSLRVAWRRCSWRPSARRSPASRCCFGPAEYFSLMVLGLIFAVALAKGSVLKAVAVIVLGLLLSMGGSDLETGAGRMTFDIAELADGIGFANIAMGVFGFAEIVRNLELPAESRDVLHAKVSGLMPTRQDLIDSSGAIARGTIVGSLLGILPGGGAVIASFAAYTFEKKMSKTPQRFGNGAIEGVAAPESANNAAAQTSFIPLLTLGIPPNAVMALMVGAMTIHGIVPGPQVMTKQPDLFWGMIASMWLGNLMLVIINLPLVGVWVTLLRVPYRLLYPSIV